MNTTCQSCQMVNINGVPCHETGCPDQWKGETRKCKWCGEGFTPKTARQLFCTTDCCDSYCS